MITIGLHPLLTKLANLNDLFWSVIPVTDVSDFKNLCAWIILSKRIYTKEFSNSLELSINYFILAIILKRNTYTPDNTTH